MKNYAIALLAVLLLVSISFIHRTQKTHVFCAFPYQEPKASQQGHPFQLALFFSEGNCKDCLEIIDTLDHLPTAFHVIGIVPDKEMATEERLRTITGAAFPIYRFSDYRKFAPIYWPTLMGIDPKGNVHFAIPTIPIAKQFLEGFLFGYYTKAVASI